MKKKIVQLSVLMALAGTANAQIADQFILPKHSTMTASDFVGQAIAKFDNYVLVGNPDDDQRTDCAGRNQMSGSALLYKDGKVIRVYKGNYFHTASDGTQVGWRVGQSVAIAGDWMAIGAPSFHFSKGKVFLVKKDQTGEFSQSITTEINIPTNDPNLVQDGMQFGRYIAMGRTTLVVVAPWATYKGKGTGAAFVYKLNNGIWSLVRIIEAPTATTLAGSVAISDDEKKIIIGSRNAVSIFHSGSNNSWILNKCITANSQFTEVGAAVDISNDRAVFTKTGSTPLVEILRLDAASGWITDQVLTTSSVYDVAIEGTKIVLGEPFAAEGRIIHLERSGSSTAPWVHKSTVGVSQAGAFPGFSVDLSNNTVAAGLFGYDYPDLVDPCAGNRADEHTGGTLLYNFDFFNGKFLNGSRTLREENEASSGIEESAAQQIVISPNPAETDFIEISTNESLLEVVAISSTGAAKQITFTNNTANISELEPGMYILQIKTQNRTTAQKLVVK